MTVSEGNLDFIFSDVYSAQKFDDTRFYRERFAALPYGKAVDFIASSSSRFMFIEVKDCYGNEAENRWRIGNNNSKRDTVPPLHDVSDRDSVDIEFAQKVAMTISALVGVLTNPTPYAFTAECTKYAESLCSDKVRNGTKILIAVLVLEGDFGNGLHTRTNKMIHREIRLSIEKKLKWLKCIVIVVDMHEIGTVKNFPFTVARLAK